MKRQNSTSNFERAKYLVKKGEELCNIIRVESVSLSQLSKEVYKFYPNKFPDISNLDVDLQKKITYFPPKFI